MIPLSEQPGLTSDQRNYIINRSVDKTPVRGILARLQIIPLLTLGAAVVLGIHAVRPSQVPDWAANGCVFAAIVLAIVGMLVAMGEVLLALLLVLSLTCKEDEGGLKRLDETLRGLIFFYRGGRRGSLTRLFSRLVWFALVLAAACDGRIFTALALTVAWLSMFVMTCINRAAILTAVQGLVPHEIAFMEGRQIGSRTSNGSQVEAPLASSRADRRPPS